MRKEFSATCSPSKQPRLDIDSILSRYEPYSNRFDSTMRNPEVQFEARREAFSPQKTATRLKRFSSINVESNYLPQSQLMMNRSRIEGGEFRPLGNVENRESRDYSDIDKRIEEIRKKYQEYAPVSASSKYGGYPGEENVLRGRTGSSYVDYRNAREYGQFAYERQAGAIQPNRMKRLTSYQEY
jgi:hypothetical protein